jgi:hypothetical protein
MSGEAACGLGTARWTCIMTYSSGSPCVAAEVRRAAQFDIPAKNRVVELAVSHYRPPMNPGRGRRRQPRARASTSCSATTGLRIPLATTAITQVLVLG